MRVRGKVTWGEIWEGFGSTKLPSVLRNQYSSMLTMAEAFLQAIDELQRDDQPTSMLR